MVWEFIVYLLIYTTDVMSEMCLVYTYGSYKHRDCDSCCESGIHRRCCSDTPDVNNSSTSMFGGLFGCMMGLLCVAGLCGTITKYCHRRKHQPIQTSAPPPVSYSLACLDSTGLHDTYPKPPVYSARVPPPPYSSQEEGSRDFGPKSQPCSFALQTGPVSQDDVGPPPYTPRLEDSRAQSKKEVTSTSRGDNVEH